MFNWKESEPFKYFVSVVAGILISFIIERQASIKFPISETEEKLKIDHLSTSGWCKGRDAESRVCSFDNICYRPESKRYVMLVSPTSSFQDMNITDMDGLLYMVGNLKDNSSAMVFDTVYVTKNLRKTTTSFQYHTEPIQWMWRSQPSNLTSVLLDDLLPFYVTRKTHCQGFYPSCSSGINLIFPDNSTINTYNSVYELFSEAKPRRISELNDEEELHCFKETHFGINRMVKEEEKDEDEEEEEESVVQSSSSKGWHLTGFEIEDFSTFVVTQICDLGLHKVSNSKEICKTSNQTLCEKESNTVVILLGGKIEDVRNRIDITQSIQDAYKKLFNVSSVPVKFMSMKTDEFASIVCAIRSSKLLISVMGDESIMSMFQRRGSGLIELDITVGFQKRSIAKFLSQIKERRIFYKQWKQKVFNPSQDKDSMLIDTKTFEPVLNEVLLNCSSYNDSLFVDLPIMIRPAAVKDIRCRRFEEYIKIKFVPPWNGKHLHPGLKSLTYVVGVRPTGSKSMEVGVSNESTIILIDKHPESPVDVMIQVLAYSEASEVVWGHCPEASHPMYLEMEDEDEEEEIENETVDANSTDSGNVTDILPQKAKIKEHELFQRPIARVKKSNATESTEKKEPSIGNSNE